jgi:formate dehydrogenase subunit beta
MDELTQAIRAEAARLLEEDVVDVVIGFRAGSLALRPQPAFFTDARGVDTLIYNGFCQNNLATYLSRRSREERVGIVCRGCESRAIRVLVSEHRHDRADLHLIGIPCAGIIDWRKAEREAGLGPGGFAEVLSISEQGDEVLLLTRREEHRLEREPMLHDSCKRCAYPDPVGTDIVLGEPAGADAREPRWGLVDAFEALSPEDRYRSFVQEAERCIRCYACREACPMCYCTECFVDYTTPRWAESMITPSGTHAWHIIRAFHQAGRCAGCGACERACPMDIKMTYLTDKLNRDMLEQYDYEVGAGEGAQPPFATFTLDDQDQFVR